MHTVAVLSRFLCVHLRRPGSAGTSPMPYLSLAIQSHGPSRQIWWTGFHTAARKRRHIPLQNTSRQRFGDVLPSMNMYVYARICTYISTCYAYMDTYERRSYMHVYARTFQHVTLIRTFTNLDRTCTYMHVYARIYMYIYASMLLPLAAQSDCDTVYERICMYMIVFVSV